MPDAQSAVALQRRAVAALPASSGGQEGPSTHAYRGGSYTQQDCAGAWQVDVPHRTARASLAASVALASLATSLALASAPGATPSPRASEAPSTASPVTSNDDDPPHAPLPATQAAIQRTTNEALPAILMTGPVPRPGRDQTARSSIGRMTWSQERHRAPSAPAAASVREISLARVKVGTAAGEQTIDGPPPSPARGSGRPDSSSDRRCDDPRHREDTR